MYHTPSSFYQYCFEYFGYSLIREDMHIFVCICASFTRWVYPYTEGCLVVSTISETDLIRSKVACVLLRVINACVQVWSILVYKYLSHANATFRLVMQCLNGLRHRAPHPRPPVERVEHLKYLGKILTNQNSIQEKVKNRLKPGNACYHSVQYILSSTLLSKNVKLKIQRTKILPVFYLGVKLGRSL